MKSIEHYLNILLSFPVKHKKGENVSITLKELTRIFYCTPRNVNLILHKLVDEGLIEWHPGSGRGIPSQMVLLRDLDEVAEEYFHQLLIKDKMKDAMDLLYHENLPASLRYKLRGLLDDRFGFQVEQMNSAKIDILRVTKRRISDSLDPAFVYTSDEVFLLQQICDTLVTFEPKNKTYLPALAHAWESSKDGSRWTFYLRKGVRFHHGRTLTSKDVLFTFLRLKEVNSPSRWQYEEIDRVETPSEYVISFYLKQPNHLFLNFFGSFYMSILPHDVDFSQRNLIGTGPFRISEFTDQVFVLEAFEEYYRERALLDRVELWFIPEDIQDDLYQLPKWSDNELDKNTSGGEINYLMNGCQYVVFNYRKEGIHHNRFFRKAMRLVSDRNLIIEELKGHRVAPADSFLPDNSKHAAYGEDTIEAAKTYLLESGYSGETLKLYFFDKKGLMDDARWLKRRCEAIGVHISLHPFPLTDFHTTEADQEADLVVICESLEDDIEWGYLHIFQNESSFLRRFFNDEQQAWLDTCIRRFVQMPSPEQRARMINRIEEGIREENWILFGYHMNKISRYHPALKGVSLDSFGWIDFSKLWIKPNHSDTFV